MPSQRASAAAFLATGLALGAIGANFIPDDSPPPPEVAVLGAKLGSEFAADAIAKAMQEAEAQTDITCRLGVLGNRPKDTLYCSDGRSAGFIVPPEVAEDLLEEIEGKIPDGQGFGLFVSGGEVYLRHQGIP